MYKRQLRYDALKWQELGTIFNLCENSTVTKSSDVDDLIGLLSDSIGTMAMVNYPYETNFVNPLPAWPIKAGCDAAAAVSTAGDLKAANVSIFDFTNIKKIQAMGKTFYNYDDSKECLNLAGDPSSGLDDNGWGVQTCNEFPMPMGDDATNTCFTWTNWDKNAFTAGCQSAYNMTPKYDWALDYFGGRNPEKDFAQASNLMFVNGDLDPWHGGGVNKNITDNTIALFIKDSAHHLDLRVPNIDDPVTVT